MTHARPAAAAAAVMERLEIRESGEAFGGAAFGDAGRYRFIRATAHLRVMHNHAANRGIVDLDLAPRTASGDVRYTADVLILRPADPARARRVMLADIPNRGMRIGFASFNEADILADLMPPKEGAPPKPPFAEAGAAGNGFLLRRGYTLLWVGWQHDVPGPATMMRAVLPVATKNGQPITGRVQASIVFDTADPQSDMDLGYPAASPEKQDAVLTVRARQGAPARTLDRSTWSFVNPQRIRIDRPSDMDAGAIYDFDYTAADPVVAGLGFAATGDVIAYLRHGARDEAGNPNPLLDLRQGRSAFAAGGERAPTAADSVDLVIGFGASQSGRYLRDMLWQGFNDDGAGRPVFDGMLVDIAGSRKTFTNRRWAEPGRFSRQHEDHLVYGNQFPFAYPVRRDPLTGAEDGIFARCEGTETCPKLFHIDGSAEFWSAGASLVATDGAGSDIAFPSNMRAYMVAGAAHAPGMTGPSSLLPPNPLSPAPLLRALLVAMDEWLSGRADPPGSRWPTIAQGELAPPSSRQAIGFPEFARLPYSGGANGVELVDYDRVPPSAEAGKAWQTLVPVTDADGNDRAGVRLPDVAVPTGTYLGWNPRKPGYAPGELSFVFGSYLPFEPTAERRRSPGDPRLSIAERYRDGADYRQRREQAEAAIRRERLYLAGDE